MSTFNRIVRSLRAFKRGLERVPVPAPARQAPRIGLALGGGFARGIAHIGVLKVLEEETIPVALVAGTSVGALIGAGYCSGASPQEMGASAARLRFKDFARWTLSWQGFASNDRMVHMLPRLLKAKTFEELRIPLAVVATDLVTGEPVVLRRGALVDAIRASCAYPGMFLPVSVEGRLLVDGMLAYPLPAEPLRQAGAERVIGVYLRSSYVTCEGPRHVFDVIGQCFSIVQSKAYERCKAQADVLVEPEVGEFAYDAFDRAAELMQAGEAAARAALPQIQQWLTQPQSGKAPAGAPVIAPAS